MKNDAQQRMYKVKRSTSGFGLFASTFFSKGDFVIEYTGKLTKNSIVDQKEGKYFFQVNREWSIDGSGRENISRYINHSCRPNCEAMRDGKRILIYAIKNIKPGEQLTYHYGREYFKEYIKTKGCRCDYCQRKIKSAGA